MSHPLDEAVRNGLDHIGTEHPAPSPAGLAAAAVRRANRARYAWIGASTAAVGVIVAGALAAAAAVGPGGLTAAAPGPPQRVITSASCSTATGTSVILDRRSGRYMQVPYCRLNLSPDGRYALVLGTKPKQRQGFSGVLTVATGQVPWLDGPIGDGVWSPDSSRLLLRTIRVPLQPGHIGFTLLDPATGTGPLIQVPYPACPDNLGPVWLPGSDRFALTRIDCTRGHAPWPVTSVTVYDLRGHAVSTRRIDLRLWEPGAFSPDGSLAVLTSDPLAEVHPTAEIVDASTFAVRRTLRLPDGTAFRGWYDADHLIVQERQRRAPGMGRETVPAVTTLHIVDLAGHVTRTVTRTPGPAVDGLGFVPVQIGPAAGVPDPDGTLTF
jgi:hypothetical protein